MGPDLRVEQRPNSVVIYPLNCQAEALLLRHSPGHVRHGREWTAFKAAWQCVADDLDQNGFEVEEIGYSF